MWLPESMGSTETVRCPPNHDALLRTVRALQTDRQARDRGGVFFINRVRDFIHAVDHGVGIDGIVISKRLLRASLAQKLVRRCRRKGVPVQAVTPEQFRALCGSDRASGIAAILRQRWLSLDDVNPNAGLCWILVEIVRSLGNLGTLIRSSQAVGGAGFILVGNAVDVYAPDVVRASMGAIYGQRFIRTSWSAIGPWTRKHGCTVIGASPDGATELHSLPPVQSPVLVLGEERQGLTAEQRQLCTASVRIPMAPSIDSLNVGVAGSLLLYEIYRKGRLARPRSDPGSR